MFIVAIFYRLQLFFFAFAISAAGLVGAGMVSGMADGDVSRQGGQDGSPQVVRAN